MATDILMPKMGESVTEGTILRWLKQPGDSVERDEIIAEISTDKVDTEIPSPSSGTLLEILAQPDETVEVGSVIARLGEPNEATGGAASAPSGGDAAASAPAADEPPAVESGATKPPAPTPAASAPEQSAAPAAAPAGGGERTPILMPKMGESVTEGTILRWAKQPGDAVERDEILAEISTDKVDTEIPSPVAGTLVEIVANEGDTVEVGNTIAYLSTGAAGGTGAGQKSASAPAASAQPSALTPKPAPSTAAAPTASNGATTNGQHRIDAPGPSPAEPVAVGEAGPIPRMSNGRFYSPLVRSIAETEGVSLGELDAISGSGREGRVTKDDVLSYLKNRPTAPARVAPQPQPQPQQPKRTPPAAPQPLSRPASELQREYGPDVEVIPMDRMRQLIAEHMVRSKHTSPHVSEVGEADVTSLVRLRESLKNEFKTQEGVALTYTTFFIAAVAKALRENPWVNASVEGTNIIVKKHVNVGMATALPDGNLIVPVIKDADRMNLRGIAHAVHDLASRARNKQLTPDEIAGGTFTLTNYGVFGLLHGAPIISQPQVAILGTGAIQKRPMVHEIDGDDVVVIRSMVYLSLSHDHRIIDGLLGGKFLSDVIANLQGFGPDTTV